MGWKSPGGGALGAPSVLIIAKLSKQQSLIPQQLCIVRPSVYLYKKAVEGVCGKRGAPKVHPEGRQKATLAEMRFHLRRHLVAAQKQPTFRTCPHSDRGPTSLYNVTVCTKPNHYLK